MNRTRCFALAIVVAASATPAVAEAKVLSGSAEGFTVTANSRTGQATLIVPAKLPSKTVESFVVSCSRTAQGEAKTLAGFARTSAKRKLAARQRAFPARRRFCAVYRNAQREPAVRLRLR